jgi:2-polyprenyl-6-hydroxyphenyl methylase/3-demethylubiquinone-9 3-methyltransferase
MNTAEIQKFSKDAPRWWDEKGPFAPLHKLNPVRIEYIRHQITQHFNLDDRAAVPFSNLSVIDVGCGGGLVCEPLARLGAAVTGIDGDSVAIDVAQNHAAEMGLDIAYRNETTSSVISTGLKYDIVLALEIIEHIDDQAAFVQDCAALCKPGGLVIFSTLNRKAKAFALGIVAAEYILRWVPRGTHAWQKFIKPSELRRFAHTAGLTAHDVTGLVFNPLKNAFTLSARDLDVNYLMTCVSHKTAKQK